MNQFLGCSSGAFRLLSLRQNYAGTRWLSILFLFVLLGAIPVQSEGATVPAHWFEEVSEQRTLHYEGRLGARGKSVSGKILGNSGIYVGDVNNSGLPDVLALGNTHPTLYLNRGEQFDSSDTFPGVTSKIQSALFVDYTQNGYQDLVFVPQTGRITLFRNTEGQFTLDHRLDTPVLQLGMELTAGDLTGNGCPDLLVLQNKVYTGHSPARQKLHRLGFDIGRLLPREDNGNRNYFLRGDCKTFRPARAEAFDRRHWSLATSTADFTGNGHLDVHVANDFFNDSLYENQGKGRFRHRYLPAVTNRNGMSSTLTDVTQNGRPDIFISNIAVNGSESIFDASSFKEITSTLGGNNFLVNQHSGGFDDRAPEMNLSGSGWGWAATFGDFTNDGRPELVQARHNFFENSSSMSKLDRSVVTVNSLKPFLEKRSTLGQTDLSDKLNDWIAHPGVWSRSGRDTYASINPETHGIYPLNARGIAQLDVSGDGFLDLLFSQPDESFPLYENQHTNEKPWVKIRVYEPYRGGTLTVTTGRSERKIPVSVRSDFHSQSTPYYHVGLSEQTQRIRVTLERPTGTITRVATTDTNCRIHLNSRDEQEPNSSCPTEPLD